MYPQVHIAETAIPHEIIQILCKDYPVTNLSGEKIYWSRSFMNRSYMYDVSFIFTEREAMDHNEPLTVKQFLIYFTEFTSIREQISLIEI